MSFLIGEQESGKSFSIGQSENAGLDRLGNGALFGPNESNGN